MTDTRLNEINRWRGTAYQMSPEQACDAVEDLLDHIEEIRKNATLLAGYCYALIDGFDAWYYRCRCCDGTSPGVNLRHLAQKDAVTHKPECPVARHTLPKVTTNDR